MDQHSLIEIILCTYNGENHLSEQLSSILEQDYPNIRLLIGDDASQDNTKKILESFQKQYPNKIVILPFKENVGIIKNFSRTLEFAEADYIMLSDQDDVWFSDKVSKTFNKMKELENKWGKDIPLLIHTDAVVVDDNLKIISKSNWKHQGLSKEKGQKLEYELIQNWMQGCTMMFNKALSDLATPIPIEAFVHDYWLGLVAMCCGHVDFLNETTLYYRQHESNRFGAIKPNLKWFLERFKHKNFLKVMNTRLMQGTIRAFILYKRYENLFPEEVRRKIEIFIDLKYQPFREEMNLRFKYGFWFHNFYRNIILILTSLFLGRVEEKFRLKI